MEEDRTPYLEYCIRKYFCVWNISLLRWGCDLKYRKSKISSYSVLIVCHKFLERDLDSFDIFKNFEIFLWYMNVFFLFLLAPVQTKISITDAVRVTTHRKYMFYININCLRKPAAKSDYAFVFILSACWVWKENNILHSVTTYFPWNEVINERIFIFNKSIQTFIIIVAMNIEYKHPQ